MLRITVINDRQPLNLLMFYCPVCGLPESLHLEFSKEGGSIRKECPVCRSSIVVNLKKEEVR